MKILPVGYVLPRQAVGTPKTATVRFGQDEEKPPEAPISKRLIVYGVLRALAVPAAFLGAVWLVGKFMDKKPEPPKENPPSVTVPLQHGDNAQK